MNRDELLSLLNAGGEVGFLRGVQQYPPGVVVKQVVTLCQMTPGPPDRFSPRALSEMPHYAAEQKMIQTKPFKLCLLDISTSFALCDWVNIYFAELDEVDIFLQQFDKTLAHLHELTDDELK